MEVKTLNLDTKTKFFGFWQENKILLPNERWKFF